MLEIYYKMFVLICFQVWPILDFKLAYLMNYWRFCDFYPSLGHLLGLGRYFSPFKAKYKNVGHYIVVEMYYKMFVPIGFQV